MIGNGFYAASTKWRGAQNGKPVAGAAGSHIDIEPLRLKAGKAGGDGLEAPFFRRKSARLLETSSLRRKVENFVVLQEGVLEVGAEDMMAVPDAGR